MFLANLSIPYDPLDAILVCSNPRSLEEVNLPAGLRKLTISDQSLEGLELPSALETLSVSVQSEENNMTEPWLVWRDDFLSKTLKM